MGETDGRWKRREEMDRRVERKTIVERLVMESVECKPKKAQE